MSSEFLSTPSPDWTSWSFLRSEGNHFWCDKDPKLPFSFLLFPPSFEKRREEVCWTSDLLGLYFPLLKLLLMLGLLSTPLSPLSSALTGRKCMFGNWYNWN